MRARQSRPASLSLPRTCSMRGIPKQSSGCEAGPRHERAGHVLVAHLRLAERVARPNGRRG